MRSLGAALDCGRLSAGPYRTSVRRREHAILPPLRVRERKQGSHDARQRYAVSTTRRRPYWHHSGLSQPPVGSPCPAHAHFRC